MSPDPYVSAGTNLIAVLMALILITIIVINFVSLRHRRTNAKCSLAIALTLISFLLATAVGSVPKGSVAMAPILGAAAFLMLGLTIASFIVGIIGIIEYSTRRRRYQKGLKRGITAIVLNCLALGLMIFGAIGALVNRSRTTAAAAAPEREPDRRDTASSKASDSASNAADVRINEWNYRFAIPRGWRRSNRPPSNPLTTLMLEHGISGMATVVSCETLPNPSDTDLDRTVSLVKERLRTQRQATISEERSEAVGDLDGRYFETALSEGTERVFVIQWVTLHRGTLYRIVTTSPTASRELARTEAKRMRAAFHIINPERTVLRNGETAVTKYESTQFEFSVDLQGTTWTRAWPGMRTEVMGEFGTQNADGNGWFCVIPVWLDDDLADVDVNHLTSALSSRINVPFPDDGVYGVRDAGAKGGSGQAFAYEPKDQAPSRLYRVRIYRQKGRALLLAAWAVKKDDLQSAVLDEALDRVQGYLPKHQTRPSIESLNETQRITHALVCNNLGLIFDRTGKFEDARKWFRRAFDYRPTDTAIASNYAGACTKLGHTDEAVDFLHGQMEKLGNIPKLRLLYADLQFAQGKTDESLAEYGKLFDSGYRDETRFAGYIAELAARERSDEALAALDRYAGSNETPALRRARANVLIFKRDFDKAIEILKESQRTAPKDKDTTVALADAYFVAKRFDDCLAECEKVIGANQASAYVYRRKGFAEFSLKRYREAKGSFEKAQALDPTSDELKTILAKVSGMLGEGANSTVKAEIEAVPLPAEQSALAKADESGPYLRDFSAWYLHLSKSIAFEKGSGLRTTERATVTVRDQQGVERFSTLEFRFDPLGEEIYVNSLVVKDAKGETIATGKVDDSYVVDDGQGETATQHKILHVPVPSLKPGATLEYVVTRREPGADRLEFKPHMFARTFPVLRSVLHFKGAVSEVKWEASKSVPKPVSDAKSLTFVVERPEVYRWEPLQAPLETFSPCVWLGDRESDWKKEAADYLEKIKERLAIETDVKEQAKKLTQNLGSDAEKIAAIARYVQRELTYKAIEFGRRARLPNPATQTLRNKYGDCKDHALLLTQMLESVGIPARLALVNTETQLRDGLPSLDQFNHVIACLPKAAEMSFIDSTNKFQDVRSDSPIVLANQRVLILDSANPRVATLPSLKTGCSVVTSKREISFPNDRDVDVTEHLVMTGAAAQPIRAVLQAIEPAHRTRHLLHTMNDKLPALDLHEATIENLDDPGLPLTLHLHYGVRNQLRPVGDQLVGTLPAVWERAFLAATPVEHRYTPFRLTVPTRFTSEIQLLPPKNWSGDTVKANEAAGPFCSIRAKGNATGNRLSLNCEVNLLTGQFPPEKYTSYCDAMNSAINAVEQPLIFKKGRK